MSCKVGRLNIVIDRAEWMETILVPGKQVLASARDRLSSNQPIQRGLSR